ncbi:hypothetical protein SNE40_000947 [Patella caerulea]|uniref:SRCR domain-containing protein n=1 Tax=Patella caerulea TaxID=87958 RepID=A0AAN8Q7M4_PATCE
MLIKVLLVLLVLNSVTCGKTVEFKDRDNQISKRLKRSDGNGDTMMGSDGQVLVYYNGIWGTICSDSWGEEESQVACREAGYQHGYPYEYYGEISKPMWLYSMECNGTETSLKSCQATELNSDNYCGSSHTGASVYCYNDDDLNEYRLVGGDKPNNGRVQVKYNNTWNYLCDNYGFYDSKANLLCKQLGYKQGETFRNPRFANITGGYWRNYFSCYNNQPLLDLCEHRNWTYEANSCYNTPGIYCYGSVRLSSKYSNSSGALLVNEGNEYKTVCADHFDQNAANVVCRELGFPSGGRILPGNNFNVRRTSINKRYRCTGYEASLMECSTEDSITCNNHVTTLSCSNGGHFTTQEQDGDTMMSSDGQVLVYYNGIWGTICPDSWGGEESQVACREAGYQHGYSYEYYGERSKLMWLYSMECNGTESSLKSCQATELNGDKYCRSSHLGASVYCYNDDDLNEYRLVGGDKPNNGRVQVKYNNTWNYLCDNYGFYDSKANLLCKQLGYKQGETFRNPRFANITGGYWRNYFSCYNNEPLLDLCEHRNWTYEANEANSCYRTPGVYCYGSVRLSSKYSNSSGALLVNEDNEYKTVCADHFDQNAVNVVCRELGFPSGGRILPGNNFNVHRSSMNKRYRCTGYEASLMECSTEDSSITCNNHVTTLSCSNGGVTCNNSVQEQDGDTMMNSDGQVLVYYNGIWGTICSDSWGEEESQVACREAGYQHGYPYEYYAERSKPMWLYAMECNGTETSLKSCHATELNGDKYCGSSHLGASAYCYNDDDLNEYRLVGGDKSNNGRVQIKYNNTWNYLCDNNGVYGSKINLLCKQLGYKQGETFRNPRFANITGGYWRNSFSCYNNQPLLDLCEHRNWTYEANSCSFTFGIYCYGSVRLSSKYSNSSGALLVNEGKEYKTVCADHFDQNAVNVVCRELGFPSGGRILPGNNFNVHRSSMNKRYRCTGYEASLMECSTEDSSITCNNHVTTLSCSNGGHSTTQVQGGNRSMIENELIGIRIEAVETVDGVDAALRNFQN